MRALANAIRGIGRRLLPLWVLIAIALGVYATIAAVSTGRENDARDEARKYQSCVQRAAGVRNQNALADVTRRSLTSSNRRQTLQAERTNDRQLRARFRLGARLALVRRDRIRVSPVPQCARIYPEGRRQSQRFPDLAPAAPTRKTS